VAQLGLFGDPPAPPPRDGEKKDASAPRGSGDVRAVAAGSQKKKRGRGGRHEDGRQSTPPSPPEVDEPRGSTLASEPEKSDPKAATVSRGDATAATSAAEAAAAVPAPSSPDPATPSASSPSAGSPSASAVPAQAPSPEQLAAGVDPRIQGWRRRVFDPAAVASGPFSESSLARELNAPQKEAVVHPPQPLLVVAGAGSGKTRVITFRIARLVAGGADPRRILAVTFTNKAAGEMRERVAHLLSTRLRLSDVGGFWAGTFHAISARLLRQYGEAIGVPRDFVIYDVDDQRRLLSRVLTDLNISDRLFPVRQVLSALDNLKNQGLGPDEAPSNDYYADIIAKVYRVYSERLRAAHATDFGGLLLEALRLCREPTPAREMLATRFDHVLVDEFQDTNSVQYGFVRFLAARSGSITVVGDEDQSIYKWRGADIRNILDFERDHPGTRVIKLEQNYRSTGHILRAANAIIARNTERREKRLFTQEGLGDLIVLFEGETERDEAEFVGGRIADGLARDMSPRDYAVFYRTNAQSRVLEDALRARNIPYKVIGGTRFFDRAEIKDLISYLRVVANASDDVALGRVVNVPARGIGEATMERLAAVARERHTSLWGAMEVAVADESLLGSGARKKLAAFLELVVGLRGEAPGLGPADLAERVLELSGYRDALAAEASPEADGRLENLLELVAQMREYEKETEEPTLHGFLERIALASDVDGYDPEKGAVSLMTVHTAKGLEFPSVFITGMEERIFPHARSVDDDAAIEEERRLCYVAVTRARRHLHLSRVRRRRLSGQELPGIPSRFLSELPPDALDVIVMERPAWYGEETEGRGPWGGRWRRESDEDLETRFGRAPRREADPFASLPPPPRRPLSPAPGKPSGEVTVDYEAGDEPSGLQVGMRLKHSQFGVGEVRGWQSAGADLKVTMKFPTVGVKTILARFLKKP
jgi:DNA helicase-2/ATP-dependent DNA helicase PcrA